MLKQVKAEIVDLEYEEAEKWKEQEEEDDALMVARKIKQELEAESPSPSSVSQTTVRERHQSHQPIEIDRPSAPIVFDHFICMRIGLNSRNNVQRLMALLAAHEFVDLTVLPSPSLMPPPPPIPAMIPLAIPRHQTLPPTRLLAACQQEPSTSSENPLDILNIQTRRLFPQFPHIKVKRNMAKKVVPKPFIRPTPSADCGIIPINMQCRKCDEILPKGSHGSSALNHVQKNHLKMAAFQCRICKHYRTTQERIQSHVTTVHKAKSTKFDSSLAGPLSADDMKKMEEMITYCFPKLKMELQVTDRLIAKTMEVDLAVSK
ncbi:hypothetical protein B9Z55_022533 [Caenorhabditis nigoni]|uniref:Uncharacterized protein n=1 Tax=Caenorhabditis nigoni TaxID=1611254 RepID=A0A2G5SKR0_9PELO|nr:hypothetical protein B9Z55_022533 [Caenorhabditis nigoni]